MSQKIEIECSVTKRLFYGRAYYRGRAAVTGAVCWRGPWRGTLAAAVADAESAAQQLHEANRDVFVIQSARRSWPGVSRN